MFSGEAWAIMIDQIPGAMHALVAAGIRAVKDALAVCLDLFKVMVPVIILVKALKEFGLISYLAAPLAPAMRLVGLPGEMGLAWATAIINNIYSGLAVYAELARDSGGLTTAQATILAVMMLIAHNLPVEAKITQKCGVGFWGQVVIRMSGALVCGLLMRLVFDAFALFTEPAVLAFEVKPEGASLLSWAGGQAWNLCMIFLVILALLLLMRGLSAIRATNLLEWLLAPLLRVMGIGRRAATITVIGLVMGIAYGGGLIIHEVKGGKISRQDVFSSITLMGLSHALVEDTLLMLLIGANLWGVLVGRLVFSLAVVAILSRLVAPRLAVKNSLLARFF